MSTLSAANLTLPTFARRSSARAGATSSRASSSRAIHQSVVTRAAAIEASSSASITGNDESSDVMKWAPEVGLHKLNATLS
jgi:hypothetical protein